MNARIAPAGPKAIARLYRQVRDNFGAFRAAYGWLLKDLIAFSRRRVMAVVALNLTGVALQWTVIGAVLVFVGELTGEGGAFQAPLLGGIEVPVEASFWVVAAWAVCVLLLVAAAAATTYGAESIGFSTAQRYVERSGQKILGATLAMRSRLTDESDPPARRLQIVLARDQIMVLRALLVIQRSLRAGLMVGVAAIVLALINPLLTGVVAMVATAFVVPYYLVNRRMVQAATTLGERNASAQASISRLVEHATSREPNAEVLRVVPDLYPADVAIADRWSTLRDIMLGGQRTNALMSGLVGTCLVAVVVAFGVLIARDGTSWVAALTFIIALNLASGAFIQLAGQVTAANRFLPHVQEYMSFAGRLARPSEPPSDLSANGLRTPLPTVRAPDPVYATSDRELVLAAGTRALCVFPEVVDRLNVHTLLNRLVAGSETDARRLREAAFFYGDASSLPPVSARRLLGERGMQALVELGLEDEIRRLPQADATVMTPDVQERLSPFLRYALGMLEGLDSELLVLGWKGFARLTPEERTRLLSVLEARPVIFIIAGTPSKQPPEITHTIVFAENRIAGMGNAKWYKKVAPNLLEEAARPQRVGVGAGTTLDDLADDG